MFIHEANKEIHIKVVYHGPHASGKVANLKCLSERFRGKASHLVQASSDPNWQVSFFDALKITMPAPNGYNLACTVLATSEQAACATYHRFAFQQVDGLVFVADSHPARQLANYDAWNQLQNVICRVPTVIQWTNSEGLVDGSSVQDKWDSVADYQQMSCLKSCEGMLETWEAIIHRVYEVNFKEAFNLTL